MNRREARNEAFLIIFEMGFKRENAQEILDCAIESRQLVLDEYSSELVLKCYGNIETTDESIKANLENWTIDRLPKTTLAILRLAICELDYFPNIPVKVSINEAVELAKTYSTKEDAAYINGVLGAYVKTAVLKKNAEADVVED